MAKKHKADPSSNEKVVAAAGGSRKRVAERVTKASAKRANNQNGSRQEMQATQVNASSRQVNALPRRPRILLAACGSVAAQNFHILFDIFSREAEVIAVATHASLRFIDRTSLPRNVLFTDWEEWSRWARMGDPVLHNSLQEWAEIMVIAPLSANTLAKMAGGLSDNLLTCILRAWDYKKPVFVAPSMHRTTWTNPFTEQQLVSVEDNLLVNLIPPDHATGAMAEVDVIVDTVVAYFRARVNQADANGQ